jgi:fatty acid-binding protein DegV
MAGVHIVTDSTASLPRDAATSFGIRIVPQLIRLGDVVREEPAAAADAAALLAELGAHAGPRALLAAPAEAFRAAYAEPLSWGVEVVALHGPADLCPIMPSAEAATALLPAGSPVEVVRTPWIGPTLGLLALRAAVAGAEGATRHEVVSLVLDLSECAHGFLLMRDPAGLGAALPTTQDEGMGLYLVRLTGGAAEIAGRPADVGEGLRALAEAVRDGLAGQDDRPLHVALVSCGLDAEAAALATFLQTRLQPVEMWIAAATPAFATLAGPGSLALGFYVD